MTEEILLHAHSTTIVKRVASMNNRKLIPSWQSTYYVVYLSW
ncbi:hypothetical protein [Lysinibacillus contaminans]|nr:hypothetical protein [Lysinibacillus contaminans]